MFIQKNIEKTENRNVLNVNNISHVALLAVYDSEYCFLAKLKNYEPLQFNAETTFYLYY